MHFNYRIKRSDIGHYEIVEAYYDNDGTLLGTINDVKPYGKTLEELRRDLKRLQKALDLPELGE